MGDRAGASLGLGGVVRRQASPRREAGADCRPSVREERGRRRRLGQGHWLAAALGAGYTEPL